MENRCPHHLHKLLEVNLAITIGVHHFHQILGNQKLSVRLHSKMPFRHHINRRSTNQMNFLRQATARSCRQSASCFMTTSSLYHARETRCGGKMWIRFLVFHLVSRVPHHFEAPHPGLVKLACDIITGQYFREPGQIQMRGPNIRKIPAQHVWLVLHQRMAYALRMQLFLADGSIPIAIENSESLPAGIFLESR